MFLDLSIHYSLRKCSCLLVSTLRPKNTIELQKTKSSKILSINLNLLEFIFSMDPNAAYHSYEACTERGIHIRISLSSSDSPIGIPRTCTFPRSLKSSPHNSREALEGFLTWLKQTVITITIKSTVYHSFTRFCYILVKENICYILHVI